MWRLCGKPVISPSLAQATGVFNIKKYEWSTEILDSLKIDYDLMPEIEVAGKPVGEITSEAAKITGLAKGTTVVTGAHDTPDCSALGAGVIYEDYAMDLTGTFETVQVCVSKERNVPKKILCWKINKTKDIYISGIGGVSSSGSLFNWYKDTFCQEEIFDAKIKGKDVYNILTAKAAHASPGSNNLLFMPDFARTDIKGTIVGLTLGHKKNEVLRALFEGINYQVRIGLENSKDRTSRIKEIRAIGGGAKSPFWVQLKADIFRKRMITPKVLEGGALGAAILAGIGVDIYKDAFDGVNKTFRENTVYITNEKIAKLYDKYFEVYKQTKKALEPIFKKLRAI
jgi:xylulokinase